MRALVHDDEIPLEPESRARRVAPAIAVREVVAVRHGALVLHARVRHLEQLVAVFVPRIRTEPVLEAFQHGERLRKLLLRRLHVICERPEVHGEEALLALIDVVVVRVHPGGDRDRIVVDRIHREPLVRRRAVGVVHDAAQPAVGDVDQGIGHRQCDALAVRLVGLCVLVRPPGAGAHPLIRRHDPWIAETVARPGKSAVPGWVLRDERTTVIVHGDRLALAGMLRAAERREKRRPLAAIAHGRLVLHHAVHLERRHEIDLHFLRRREHAIGDRVAAANRAVGRVDRDAQVVEHDVPPCALRGLPLAAQRVGAREHRPPALRARMCEGNERRDDQGEMMARHESHDVNLRTRARAGSRR